MTDAAIFQIVGVVFMIISVALFLKDRAHVGSSETSKDTKDSLNILGQSFTVSTPSLVFFLVGAAIFVFPFTSAFTARERGFDAGTSVPIPAPSPSLDVKASPSPEASKAPAATSERLPIEIDFHGCGLGAAQQPIMSWFSQVFGSTAVEFYSGPETRTRFMISQIIFDENYIKEAVAIRGMLRQFGIEASLMSGDQSDDPRDNNGITVMAVGATCTYSETAREPTVDML